MTQDEYEVGSLENAEKFAIIRMAREAGFEYAVDNERWYRFAALVAANEREKQAEQEPVAWKDMAFARLGVVRDKMRPEDVETVQRFLDGDYAVPMHPVKQEPMAWIKKNDTCTQLSFERFKEGAIPLYAAPVRTKDLTDDEIYKLADDVDWAAGAYLGFARAVIAADREKNNAG